MKTPAIDEPLRLGGSFWILYACLMGPSLWLFQPWTWDAPVYSIIAGFILPPFLAGIVLYCFALFTFSLIVNFQGQKYAFCWFVAALIGPTLFLVAAWFFSGQQPLPSLCAFIASFIGYSILHVTHRKSTDRTPRSAVRSR